MSTIAPDGSALPVFQKEGRHYIVGVPGPRSTRSGFATAPAPRILVVTSRGRRERRLGATPPRRRNRATCWTPWGLGGKISGWRKSPRAHRPRFYFTDLGDSYAARTGRPQKRRRPSAVAVFQEAAESASRIGEQDIRGRLAEAEGGQPTERSAKNEARARRTAAATGLGPGASGTPRDSVVADELSRQEPKDQAKSLSKLGTGHGRNEESPR